jgi:hypothetical protein
MYAETDRFIGPASSAGVELCQDCQWRQITGGEYYCCHPKPVEVENARLRRMGQPTIAHIKLNVLRLADGGRSVKILGVPEGCFRKDSKSITETLGSRLAFEGEAPDVTIAIRHNNLC